VEKELFELFGYRLQNSGGSPLLYGRYLAGNVQPPFNFFA